METSAIIALGVAIAIVFFVVVRGLVMWYTGTTQLITQMKLNNYLLYVSLDDRVGFSKEKTKDIESVMASENF